MTVKELVLILALTTCAARGIDYHETLDDEYDIKQVSLDELTGILNCLSDTGPCTDLAASYRKNYPDVIIEACTRCTPIQKRSLCKFMKRTMKDLPERFKVFLDKHDPKNVYFDKFLDAIKGC